MCELNSSGIALSHYPMRKKRVLWHSSLWLMAADLPWSGLCCSPPYARLISIWTYDPSAGTFILIGHFVVPSDTDRPHPNSFGLPSRLSLGRSLCLSRIELGCQPFFLGSLQNS
ncbi:hypothetical protein FS842_004364 [Serendipita sp. 407]|nr:hypothetical protein FS842_004364 [Serendipita sp. 407]